MTAIDALLEIRAAGGTVTIEDGRLVVDVDSDPPETVWQAVAEHRDEIVRLLKQAGNPVSRIHNFEIPANGEVSDTETGGTPAPCSWEGPFPRGPHRQPAGVDCCDRCGSTETVDDTIHGGLSIRQDCARCGRFRKFTRWHGVAMP